MRVDQSPLAEGLREGVGVRPPESLGPRPAGIDQLLAHPVVAQLLGPFGQHLRPGRTQLGARRLGEASQGSRTARLGPEVLAQSSCGVDLGGNLDVGGDRAVGPGACPRPHGLGEQGLGGLALVGARHIGGRHRDEMGAPASGVCRLPVTVHRLDGGGDARGPQEVDLDGRVEGGVEGDRRRRVDDDVARRQDSPPLVVEIEAVVAHVSRHRDEPTPHLVGEAVAPFGAQAVEAVVAHDLASGPLRRRQPAGGSYEHHDLAVGDRPQESLHHGCTEEPGGPRHQDPGTGQGAGDRQGTWSGLRRRALAGRRPRAVVVHRAGGRDTHLGHHLCLPYGR